MFEFDSKWSARHITVYAQSILRQIPWRAGDRGLHAVDASSLVMLALWSLLLWERNVGRVALEHIGVDPFDLARRLDGLLNEKVAEYPVVYDARRKQAVLARTGEAYEGWDFDGLVEPLLQQAEHEARRPARTALGGRGFGVVEVWE